MQIFISNQLTNTIRLCYNIRMKAKDLTNQKFGRLLVIKQAPRKNGRIMWECLCECGKTVIVETGGLTRPQHPTISCGCYTKDRMRQRNTVHGQARTKLYYVWKNIRKRCYNIKDKSYDRYGGRGIEVCEEWKKSFQSFYNWAHANGYNENAKYGECTLDRIDVNGNYCPENCRWVSFHKQANNRTNTQFILFNGESHSLSDWAKIVNIDYQCLYSRIHDNHWDIEKALTTPSKGNPWERHKNKLLDNPH